MRWKIGTLIIPNKKIENSPYAVIVDYNEGEYKLIIQRGNEREIRTISEGSLETWESDWGHKFIT